jgi:hypothetical protein
MEDSSRADTDVEHTAAGGPSDPFSERRNNLPIIFVPSRKLPRRKEIHSSLTANPSELFLLLRRQGAQPVEVVMSAQALHHENSAEKADDFHQHSR